MNLGVAYEQLVRGVVAAIGVTADVETLELTTRAPVKGRTMTHEADVWWRFRAGDRERSVWVTCKDWQRAVPNGAMWEFAGKLRDIDPRPHGVFVVRNRLQAGALKAASANGITAWEVRDPAEEDWEGRAQKTVTTLVRSVPQRKLRITYQTRDGVISATEERVVRADEVHLVAADGDDLGSLHALMDALTPTAPLGEETDWTTRTRWFDPPAQLHYDDSPGMPVSAVEVRSRWVVTRHQIRTGTEDVALIIRDALGDGMSVIREGIRARADDVAGQLLGD